MLQEEICVRLGVFRSRVDQLINVTAAPLTHIQNVVPCFELWLLLKLNQD